MNITVVRAHFVRALELIESLEKIQKKEPFEDNTAQEYEISGRVITLGAHLKGGTERIDKFFKNGEDRPYAKDLMRHLSEMNSHIKEAIAFIFELAVPRMAMRDLPSSIRMGDRRDREDDMRSIRMVKRTVQYAIEDLDIMAN